MIFSSFIALLFMHRSKKKNFNRNIKTAFWVCLIGMLMIDAPALSSTFRDPQKQAMLPILIFVGIDLAILVWIVVTWIQKASLIKRNQENQESEKAKESEADKKRLFDECKANGLTDASTPEHRQAVLLIARNHYSFASEEDALRAFEEGRIIDNNIVAEQNRQAEIANTLRIEESIRQASAVAEKVARIKGKDKYILAPSLLSNMVNTAYPQMQNVLLYKASKGPSYISHEKNWGIAGGIASGIGGVGAGIMAASDTIRNNEKIREMDKLDYKMRSQMYEHNVLKGTRDVVYDLELAQEGLKAYLESLNKILIDDTEERTKAANLIFEAGQFKVDPRDNGRIMRLNVMAHCAQTPTILNHEAFVDGAVFVKCFLGETLIGKGYLLQDGFLSIISAEETSARRNFQPQVRVHSDLSGSRLDKENTAVLVSEGNNFFCSDANYRFEFEPVHIWYTQKEDVELFRKDISHHDAARAISNYFYSNGGAAEMTYKAMCVNEGENWIYDYQSLKLVKKQDK